MSTRSDQVTNNNVVRPDPYAGQSIATSVRLAPNEDYPADLQGETTYVTKDDPWVGHFLLDDRYIHRNQRNDHRFHRNDTRSKGTEEERRTTVPDVNKYMTKTNRMEVFEIERLRHMPRRRDNEKLPVPKRVEDRNTLEGSWEKMWAHIGRYVRFDDPRPALPCDTLYLRHPSEEQYQRRLRSVMIQFANHIRTHGSADNYDWASIRSVLPKPITSFYMFREYGKWVEDGAYEKRSRDPPVSQGRRTVSLYVSWSNINMYAVPVSKRHEVYIVTPSDILQVEPPDLLPTPSAPAVAYTSGDYIHGCPELRRLIVAYYRAEQIEVNITSFILAGKNGIPVSRDSDPRLTTSGPHGIITPLPGFLIQEVDPDVMLDMFDGTDVDPAAALLMFWRCYEIDWARCEHPGTPFFWYTFADGHVHPLPYDEEREPKFNHSVPGRPLTSWCVRAWRPCAPVYKQLPDGPHTYARCAELIAAARQRRDTYAVSSTHTEQTEAVVVPAGSISTQQGSDVPTDNWVLSANKALRSVYADFGVNVPRCGDELVDWVRGMATRKRDLQDDVQRREQVMHANTQRITTLTNTLTNTEETLRAVRKDVAAKQKSITIHQKRIATLEEAARVQDDNSKARTARSDPLEARPAEAHPTQSTKTSAPQTGRRTTTETDLPVGPDTAESSHTVEDLRKQVTTLQNEQDANVRKAVDNVTAQLTVATAELTSVKEQNEAFSNLVDKYKRIERTLTDQLASARASVDSANVVIDKLREKETAFRARELEYKNDMFALHAQLRLIHRGNALTLKQLEDAGNTYCTTSQQVIRTLNMSYKASLGLDSSRGTKRQNDGTSSPGPSKRPKPVADPNASDLSHQASTSAPADDVAAGDSQAGKEADTAGLQPATERCGDTDGKNSAKAP